MNTIETLSEQHITAFPNVGSLVEDNEDNSVIQYTSSLDGRIPTQDEIFALNMGRLWMLAEIVEPRHAQETYHIWIDEAYRLTKYTADIILPDQSGVLSTLKNATALLHNPAELHEQIILNTLSDEEITTIDSQRNLAELIGRVAARAKEGDLTEELEVTEQMLKKRLFVPGTEAVRDVISVHDMDTGKVKNIVVVELGTHPLTVDLGEVTESDTVRIHARNMGFVEDIGLVEINTRIKGLERGILKLLERGVNKVKAGKSGNLVAAELRDLYGIQANVVALMDDSRTSPTVTCLLKKITEISVDSLELQGHEIEVEEDHKVNGDPTQSGKFAGQRLQYKLKDRPLSSNPLRSDQVTHASLEVFVHSDRDKYDNLYETERSTGENDARAHLGIEVLRAGVAAKILLGHFEYDIDEATADVYRKVIDRIPSNNGIVYQEALNKPVEDIFSHTSYDIDLDGNPYKGVYTAVAGEEPKLLVRKMMPFEH